MTNSDDYLLLLRSKASLLSRALSAYHRLGPSTVLLHGGIGECFIHYSCEISKNIQPDKLCHVTLHTFLDVFGVAEKAAKSKLDNEDPEQYLKPPRGYSHINIVHKREALKLYLGLRRVYRRQKIKQGCLNATTWIHKAAWLGPSFTGLPFLHDKCFSKKPKKNRRRLIKLLKEHGFANVESEYIGELLPTSYVEQFQDVYSLSMKLKIASVFTSMYGLMLDPVLALSTSARKSDCFYVQHGGAYCLYDNWLHRLEESSCTMMFHWGLGEINVAQTRFAISENPFRPHTSILSDEKAIDFTKIVLMTGFKWSDSDLLRALDFINSLLDGLEFKARIELCDHPRAQSPLAAAFCTKHGWQYSVGSASGQNVTSGLVIYDSLQHTLLLERIIQGLPFLVPNWLDPYAEPQFSRAQQFVDSLLQTRIACTNFNDSYLSNISKESLSNYGANEFLDISEIARGLLAGLPSLAEMAHALTGCEPAASPSWLQ